jgi:hypothetical protein
MAVPLEPDWSDFPFTFDDKASRAVVSFGGLGQAPFDLPYDSGGIIWTSVFNFAVPTLFIVLGVAADQGGKAWSDLCKSVVAKGLAFVEAAADRRNPANTWALRRTDCHRLWRAFPENRHRDRQ